jgi:predicted nucleic acid-binding protein
MRKPKIYLDTSVISYLYQLDAPEKMNDMLALWEEIQAGEYQAVISEITTKEMNNMNKPDISPDFTIEDIHKIREYHYELTKDMTFEEVAAFYHEGAKEFQKCLAERKRALSGKEFA